MEQYKYIKLLTKNLHHRNFQWKFGRNDIENFNYSNECTSNALYVCEPKDFFEWMFLYEDICWVAYATIPEDAEHVIMNSKVKASSVILHEPLIPIAEFIPIAVNAGADINARDGYVLRQACEFGRLDIIKSLFENGANIHACDNYPVCGASITLLMASANGHLEVVKLLMEHGMNVHAQDDYALRRASSNGYFEIVKYLVEHGANIHAYDDEALRYAAYNDHLDVVKYLVEKGADIYTQNDYALRWASANGRLDMVEYLKEQRSKK